MTQTARPLNVLDGIPEGLLDLTADELYGFLGGPTLIHIDGDRQPALFVSALLHGNEVSGWNGLRRLLVERSTLPRAMTVFLGNLAAAAAGQRVLDGQPDYNRIWRVPEDKSAVAAFRAEGAELAAGVTAAIQSRSFFAAVDLHNNTGHNPHYSVITGVEPQHLGLAYLFSDKAVYIQEPATTMTGMLAERCPAVALELGPVGDPRCDDRALDFLNQCLALDEAPTEHASIRLFRSVARVHIRAGIEFSFADDDLETPLVLTGGVEAVNFHSLPMGAPFAASTYGVTDVLRVLDAAHRDVTDEFLDHDGEAIVLKRSVVPAMYTTDPYVARQDCLCYFMEPMDS